MKPNIHFIAFPPRFTLTMRDVNVDNWFEEAEKSIEFYINYVGCKQV